MCFYISASAVALIGRDRIVPRSQYRSASGQHNFSLADRLLDLAIQTNNGRGTNYRHPYISQSGDDFCLRPGARRIEITRPNHVRRAFRPY